MSIEAMTNRAVEDRLLRQGDSRIVSEALDERKELANRGTGVRQAADSIVTYIPTEIVTVYVAAAAAIHTAGSKPGTGQWILLGALLVLTPITTWALFAAKIHGLGESMPVAPRNWPWLHIIIASIAFLLWSFTLPNTPFEQLRWYTPGLAAVVLLVGTMVLGLAAPFFRPSAPTRRAVVRQAGS
jgi:hypothetical protein